MHTCTVTYPYTHLSAFPSALPGIFFLRSPGISFVASRFTIATHTMAIFTRLSAWRRRMTMPALHKTAHSPQRKRLHWMLVVIAASTAVTACGDDASMPVSQAQNPPQPAQRPQQPALATTFNATPTSSTSAAVTTLQAPQSPAAQAQTAFPGGASAADSVVLAPPVIHTVD